jgi:mxaJ protein
VKRTSFASGRRVIGSLLFALAAPIVAAGARTGAPPLRVCADPNNLPFSNDKGEGFENRLAELLAEDLQTRVEYTWWPQRRGFIRNTLQAGACDVVMGFPTSSELVRTSEPYYRSTYVFVMPRTRRPVLTSMDDRRLRSLRVGVQMIGDDFANSPPAHALAARGLTDNVVGFSVLGDYSKPNPPARIVEAVASGDIDVALVWGPLAGYFARRSSPPLVVAPIAERAHGPLPFVFDISMAVRKDDAARVRVLNGFLSRRKQAIDAVLDEFDVPRAAAGSPAP